VRIHIESNFVIPGMQGSELELADGATIRQVLDDIVRIAEGRIEFFQRGTDTLDADWEVAVNGVPCSIGAWQMETRASDGDVIAVRLFPIGGG
jgi:hypothetical protein